MNNAAINLSAQNSNANAGQASTVTREGGCVTYRNLQAKGYKRGGRVYEGEVHLGQHAMVEPRKRIVLWGVDRNHVRGIRPYRLEFKKGDTAVYGGYNLTYTGTIVEIGEKTVTIEDDCGSSRKERHRLTIERFSRWNDDFDLEKIQKRNREWMD